MQRARVHPAAAAWACFAAAAAVAVAAIGAGAAGTTFAGDEWGLLYRLVDRPLPEAALDPPLGKYLVVVPTLLYAFLAEVFGTNSYLPYRIVGLVLVVLAAGLFCELARRRAGYGFAVGGAVLLLFFGAAAEVVAIPGRVPSQIAICAGLGMLIALDRGDRRGDVAACALCVIAVTSHPVGLAFLAAAGVRVGFDDRASRWRRSWVVLGPFLLYALWYVTTRESVETARPALSDVVSFAWEAFVAACAAVTGIFHSPWTVRVDYETVGSTLVAVGLIGIAALAVVRARRLTPGTAAVLVALGVAVIGPALAPGGLSVFRQPDSARYLYPGAILILLVTAELIAAQPPGPRVRPLALGVGALALASGLYSNVAHLVDQGDRLGEAGDAVRAEFRALELAQDASRGKLPPGVPPADESIKSLEFSGGPLGTPPAHIVRAAPAYFEITDRFGSPAMTTAELQRADPGWRQRAGTVLSQALPVRLGRADAPPPAAGAKPPAVRRAIQARVTRSGSCVGLRPDRAAPRPADVPPAPDGSSRPALALLSSAPGRLWIDAGDTDRPLIAVGRLTEVPVYPVEWELPGSSASLGLPRAGLGDEQWALLVYSSRELELCSYRAGAAS